MDIPYELSRALAEAFTADSAFTGVTCVPEQTGDAPKLPEIFFDVKFTPLNATGTAFQFSVNAICETTGARTKTSDPDPALPHAALVSKLFAKLLTTGKAALLSTLNALGPFDLKGWSAGPIDPQFQGYQFRTPIALIGTGLLLPVDTFSTEEGDTFTSQSGDPFITQDQPA